MAGPGKRGIPAKTQKVELHKIRVQIIDMLDRGLTYSEIAMQTGYHPKTIPRIVKRVMQDDLINAGAERLRARNFRRLDALYEKLMPALEAAILSGDFSPFDKAVRIVHEQNDLMGLKMPQQLDVHITDESAATNDAARELADNLREFMDLADRFTGKTDYGSGRSPDEQVAALTATSGQDSSLPVVVDPQLPQGQQDDDDSDHDPYNNIIDVEIIDEVLAETTAFDDVPGRWIGDEFIPTWDESDTALLNGWAFFSDPDPSHTDDDDPNVGLD